MADLQGCGQVLQAALVINGMFMEASNGEDTISKEAAVKLLRKELGPDVKKDEIEKVFQKLDKDSSGALDFQEFLALVGSTAVMFNKLIKAQKC